LRHGHAPFAAFISHDANVGLGSDSVASNNVCDILEEARFATLLARASGAGAGLSGSSGDPPAEVCAGDALFAATLGGARALGLDHQVGALQRGLAADIAIISLDGAHQQPVRDPQDALVFCSSGRDVVLTMVAGKEIYRDNRILSVNEEDMYRRLASLSGEMDG
jgi:5-methylthioadenosine/S-adenosylhomocysteine deaminase